MGGSYVAHNQHFPLRGSRQVSGFVRIFLGDCSTATRCPDRPFPGSVLNASDEDEKLVEKVAREIVEQHGDDAVEIVNERAEAAGLLAHELAAETWRDTASAAARMFRESRGYLVF